MTKIIPRVIFKRRDVINYVLDKICDYYDIPLDELTDRKARDTASFKRKRMAITILRNEAECSYKDIQASFKYGDEANTWFIRQNMTDDLNSNSSCNRELKQEYADVVKFIGV